MAHRLSSLASQFVAGLVFGLGLAVAGMTHPLKVLAFLDVASPWDPSLLFVLGAAVAVAALAYRYVLRRQRPLLDESFHVPAAAKPDAGLVFGSLLFGIGWGIAGYCPGPGIALLAVPGNPETWIFLGGLFLGFLADAIHTRLRDR